MAKITLDAAGSPSIAVAFHGAVPTGLKVEITRYVSLSESMSLLERLDNERAAANLWFSSFSTSKLSRVLG